MISPTALYVLVGLAVSVGGLFGWVLRGFMDYLREARAARRQAEASEWTPGDDEWLDRYGIIP